MSRALLLAFLLAAGCASGSETPDASSSRDAGADAQAVIPADAATDAQVADAASDAAPADGGPSDGGSSDGGPVDGGPSDGGPTLGDDCATDADCASGAEWCEGGKCVECDNSGLACRIVCPAGWSVYTRNGCNPCECAPANGCTSDGECHTGDKCYAGAFCWDWCPPGDPSCCFGNLCSAPGCSPPPPVGCRTRGCPTGQRCDLESGCTPSGCSCTGPGWTCTGDCGGGVCVSDT